MATDHTFKATPDLRVGDIVSIYGMRCLIDREPSESGNRPGTYSTRALVLNRDEVPSGLVPTAWTRTPDGEHRWTIQGNDLARWYVERPNAGDDYTARAKREAAAIIADNYGGGQATAEPLYHTQVNLVAQAWLAGYRAAIEDRLGGEAA